MLISHFELNSKGVNNGTTTANDKILYYSTDILALKAEGANLLICLDTDYPKNGGSGPLESGNAAAGAIVSTMGIVYSGRIALPCPPHCSKGKSIESGDGGLTFADALALVQSVP